MVEDPVKNNFQSIFMALRNKVPQVFIDTQSGIQFFIIRCFISMTHRLKQRTDVEAGHAQFLQVINPWQQSIQSVHRFGICIFFRRTRQS